MQVVDEFARGLKVLPCIYILFLLLHINLIMGFNCSTPEKTVAIMTSGE